jgi:plasmid stability protein
MSALVIRNLPDHVHAALRRAAADQRVSVETLARRALVEVARANAPAGIDFGRLARDSALAGFAEDGPEWDARMDDSALSRRVLGLE